MTTAATPATAAPDPLAAFEAAERATLAALADHLIPEAHGMPSAGVVIDDKRLRFVLTARPDLSSSRCAPLCARGWPRTRSSAWRRSSGTSRASSDRWPS